MKNQSDLNPRIIKAYKEVMADIEAGRYVEQSVAEHIKSLEEELNGSDDDKDDEES